VRCTLQLFYFLSDRRRWSLLGLDIASCTQRTETKVSYSSKSNQSYGNRDSRCMLGTSGVSWNDLSNMLFHIEGIMPEGVSTKWLIYRTLNTYTNLAWQMCIISVHTPRCNVCISAWSSISITPFWHDIHPTVPRPNISDHADMLISPSGMMPSIHGLYLNISDDTVLKRGKWNYIHRD
jgi:hypothetical protein